MSSQTDIIGVVAVGVLGYLGLRKAEEYVLNQKSSTASKFAEPLDNTASEITKTASTVSEINKGLESYRDLLRNLGSTESESSKGDISSSPGSVIGKVVSGWFQRPTTPQTVSQVPSSTPSALAVAKAGGAEAYSKYVTTLTDEWTKNLEAAKKVNSAIKQSNSSYIAEPASLAQKLESLKSSPIITVSGTPSKAASSTSKTTPSAIIRTGGNGTGESKVKIIKANKT